MDLNIEQIVKDARAIVSVEGQIIECNANFAYVCGFKEKLADTVNLTSISKFNNPTEMLESLYLLSTLDKAQHWKVSLGNRNSELLHLDFEIIVRLSERKVRGESVLEATIKETQFSEQRKSRTSSFCSFSSKSDSMYGSIKSEYGSPSEKSWMQSMSQSQPMTPRNMHQKAYNVLIVEDSLTSLKMMTRMVTRLGHEVSTATDGAEALSLLKRLDFDMVIMDINMPTMNGLEASHAFRKIEMARRNASHLSGNNNYRPHLKLIAISGDISPTIFYEVMNAGFDGFVPKPLTESSFVELLHTIETRK